MSRGWSGIRVKATVSRTEVNQYGSMRLAVMIWLLRAGMFEHVHAAEHAHRIAVEGDGRRHDRIASIPIAAGEDERDNHAQGSAGS